MIGFVRMGGGLLLAIWSAGAAETRLTGRVTTESNAPVPGTSVVLHSQASIAPWRQQAITDPRGAFSLVLPAAGAYLLDASKEGYFAVKGRALRLTEGDNEITVTLAPLREVFQSVDVSAEVPGIDPARTEPERRLDNKQLMEVPYPTTNNLRNVLRAIPGVVQDSQGGLHVQGGAEEQTLYTLDGFNISDPLSGKLESRLAVEAVQSVEILSGRFSAEYGKGSSGVLAINTATGDDKFRYTATNFIPGVTNHKGLMMDNWTPRFGFSGPLKRGRAWLSDTLDAHYNQHVVEELPRGQDRTTSLRWSNLLRSQVNLTPSNILYTSFLANYFFAPRSGLSVLDPRETTVDIRARQWFMSAKDQIYLGHGALLEVGYAANRTFRREIPQGEGMYILTPDGKQGNFFADAMRKSSRDQVLANMFLPMLTWFGGHQVKVGVDLDRVEYWQNVRRTGFEYLRADSTPVRRVEFGGPGRLWRTNAEASTYIQDSWRLRPRLTLELGVRQDWDRILRDWSYSPRVGLAWSPPGYENTKISAGWGVVHDATNLRMFSRPLDQYLLTTYYAPDGQPLDGPAVSLYTIENPRLRTPRYQNSSVGLEQRLPGDLHATIGYLRKRGHGGFTYFDALQSGDPSLAQRFPGFQPYPIGAIYNLGNFRRDQYDAFELTVRQPIRKQYEWMASYTRSRAFSSAVMDVSVDDPLIVADNVGRVPWDSPNRFLSWGYLPTFWKNWALAYFLEVRDGFPFSIQDEQGRVAGDVNSMRFPVFFELNLHAERRLVFRGHKWALRAGFNNITNHRNPNVVNNVIGAPNFLMYAGGQSRTMNLRIRWLGKM